MSTNFNLFILIVILLMQILPNKYAAPTKCLQLLLDCKRHLLRMSATCFIPLL